MSNRAEDVLFAALSDVDEVEYLAKEGLADILEIIPTEEMRPVVGWAIEYFLTDRKRAPSRQALLDTWGRVLEDAEIELLPEDEEHDSVEWALELLRAQSVDYQSQTFLKDFATSMSKASPVEKVETLAGQANSLYALALSMQPSKASATLEGIEDRWLAYQDRAEKGHRHEGMTFGLPLIDDHTYGIHPGELGVLAAGPKTGKSLFLLDVGYHEIQQERRVALFTLENSVDMTLDRMICRAAQVDARRFQRGLCTPEEIEKIQTLRENLPPDLITIIMPQGDQRTIAALYRQAAMLDVDTILIDQMTFIDHPSPGRKAKHEIIGEIMHELKERISTGSGAMSCLLAHQINREGVKAAEKTGRLEMYHMAEGSEMERTADWAFGLYRSAADREARQAKFQILAARREDDESWILHWDVARGQRGVIGLDRGEE